MNMNKEKIVFMLFIWIGTKHGERKAYKITIVAFSKNIDRDYRIDGK